MSIRGALGLAVLLAGLLLSSCGGRALVSDSPSVSLVDSTEESTPDDRRESMQLIILHTNDNWGETEPCG
jgi:hypothetical protein